MKIRIKGNSIRLRLSKSEIDRFAATSYLEEKTEFGVSSLVYAIAADKNASELSANFEANKITVQVPTHMHREWTTTDCVGFENKLKTGENSYLLLLIEKDFVCLDNTLEDQSDNFPNPNSVC